MTREAALLSPAQMFHMLSGFVISQALYVVTGPAAADQLIAGSRTVNYLAPATGPDPDVRAELSATLRGSASAVAGRARPAYARNERHGQLSEHHRQQPAPILEPAAGVAAYRALAEAARHARALEADREPRQRAGEGAVRHALWQRAVRQQARISGIGEPHANNIVTSWSTISLICNSRSRGLRPRPGCARPRSMRRSGTQSGVTTSRASQPSKPGHATGPGARHRRAGTRLRCP